MKNVQIPEDLFLALASYHLKAPDPALLGQIEAGLAQKVDAMLAREIYEEMKKAPTPEQRERARLEYLSLKQQKQGPGWR